MARKPTDIVPIQIRMREGLRRKLEQSATKNDQSLNSEMVSILESHFDEQAGVADFRAAMGVLSGGGENAKLLGWIASALHLVTVNSRGVSVEMQMDRFSQAVQGLASGFIGYPRKLFTYEELGAMKGNERYGAMCADTILRNEGLPGLIEDDPAIQQPILQRLMTAAK